MWPARSFKFPLLNTGNQQSGHTENIFTWLSTKATFKSASPNLELSIATSFITEIKLLFKLIFSQSSEDD